eukprot:751078-Hanusia_phi.AAC.4
MQVKERTGRGRQSATKTSRERWRCRDGRTAREVSKEVGEGQGGRRMRREGRGGSAIPYLPATSTHALQ